MDLSDEEKLSLLKSEFDNASPECLEDVFNTLGQDYESARQMLKELFPPESELNLTNDQNILFGDSSVFLEITPDIFSRLHCKFGSHQSQSSIPIIVNDFETQGSFLLPLDKNVALAIYENILKHVQLSNANANNNINLSELENSIDPTTFVSIQSIFNTESSKLNEIMDLEVAMQNSRKDYLENLTRKVKSGCVDDAVKQELFLEKKRDFLFQKFPGLDISKLNSLFEINCYDLNQTIKDIEALFNFKLPKFYRHSLYSEILKRSSETTSAALSEVTSSDEDSNQFDENEMLISVNAFKSKINDLIEDRSIYHIKITHLQQKRAQFRQNNQLNISLVYQYEIDKCRSQLKQLSDDIVYTYINHDYPNNEVDLHGLIMSEVHKIIPSVLRGKQENIIRTCQRKVKFKIITGVGSNGRNYGPIRNYIIHYIQKLKISYTMDGPGAFVLTLSNSKLINFP